MKPEQRIHEFKTRNIFYFKKTKVRLDKVKGIRYYTVSVIYSGSSIFTEVKQAEYKDEDPLDLINGLPSEVMV